MNDYLLRPAAMLRAEGWNSRHLRQAVGRGELVRAVRGVYRAPQQLAAADAHLARARAIVMRQGDSVVLSHASAALAHGLPVESDDPGVVHLTVSPPARGRRRSGYHVHVARLDPEDVVELDGVRTTSLTRTASDLARSVPYAWGVIGVDAALRRGVPREDLREMADRCVRMAGAGTLRRVLDFADPRAESPLESISRVTLVRAGLPAPELQFQVTNDAGWVATSDFAWPDHGVVGEADGAGKYAPALAEGQTPQQAVAATLARDELIRQAGWWPSHWGWAVAWDVHRLGEQVRGALNAPPRRRAG